MGGAPKSAYVLNDCCDDLIMKCSILYFFTFSVNLLQSPDSIPARAGLESAATAEAQNAIAEAFNGGAPKRANLLNGVATISL